MREVDGRRTLSRVKGRQAIVRSLRGLIIRVHRFGTKRAVGDDVQWAQRLSDGLKHALEHAAAGDRPPEPPHPADDRFQLL